MSDYFRQNSESVTFYPYESWAISSGVAMQIKTKMELVGKPLRDWNVKIYRGILTGFNEAFIIDSKTRQQLIEISPNSDEIIRPILLGKDVKRYSQEWKNLWIIFTRRGVNIELYPAIKSHLLQYYDRLLPKTHGAEIGRKPGSYQWYEIQDNVAYFEDFEKPKIAWGNLALKAQFAFIEEGFYINAPSAFIATDNLYLLAVLNSRAGDFYVKQLGVSRSGGYIEYKPMFVENVPIPVVTKEQESSIGDIVRQIINDKKRGIDTSNLEYEIDRIICDLYTLSQDEIEFLLNNQ